jgi:hypothetical protein
MQKEPFDYAIQLDDTAAPRKAILDAIKAVQALADDTAQAAGALGLQIDLETAAL